MSMLTYTLCLGTKVTLEELAHVVHAEGGTVIDQERSFLTLQKGKDVLYIIGPRYSPKRFDYDDTSLEEIEKVLGVRPVAFVSLDSQIGNGLDMAFVFAAHCMKRWPCVLDDLDGKLFTPADVAEIIKDMPY